MAIIINGSKISEEIKKEIKQEVEEMVRIKGVRPGLAVVLVGDNPASKVYVRNKQKSCLDVGMISEYIKMDANVSTEEVIEKIDDLNLRNNIHGILVQLPLPPQISKSKVLEAIFPEKDVDGFHPVNMGKLLAQEECFIPATPAGIMEILRRENINVMGKNATVVGRSVIVGRPFSILLINESATVTVCHSKTKNMRMHTRSADILIVSAGVPRLIKEDMVKEDAVVIDVGINRITRDQADKELLEWRKEDFEKKGATLIGDVDFLKVEPKASYITPVPGGVGPMTIAMLLKNTLKAAKIRVDVK